MELLTWLTIIYLIVLVAVLAVGLILILAPLREAAERLGRIGAGLRQVDTNTAPLRQGLTTLNNSLEGLAGGLQVAEESFAAAREHLQETLDSVTAATR